MKNKIERLRLAILVARHVFDGSLAEAVRLLLMTHGRPVVVVSNYVGLSGAADSRLGEVTVWAFNHATVHVQALNEPPTNAKKRDAP